MDWRTFLENITKVGGLVGNVLGAWEKASAISDWSEWSQEQIDQSLQSLRESTFLSVQDLDRWYVQEIAYTQEKEREYVGNIQAYYGARGVELWGSAIQKAMEVINKTKNYQNTLYQAYLLKRQNLLTAYENRAKQLAYNKSWLEQKEKAAQREKWFEIGKDIVSFSTSGGLKSLGRLWEDIKSWFD